MKILVINPGSTTTKIAVFEDKSLVFESKIDHAKDADFQTRFSKPGDIFEQFDFRLSAISQILAQKGIEKLDAVVGRGGNMPNIKSGTYAVNAKMMDVLRHHALAQHASNLGAELAGKLAEKFGAKQGAFVIDPVSSDEIEPKHKITGIPGITRYAGWHALNQKAVAREYAQSIGKKYEDLNLIVAHLGGGSSFGAHRHGRAINVISAVAGEGPMTPERSGAVPLQALIELCFSKTKSKEEILHLVTGGGGLYAHLGTKDLIELEKKYPNLDKEQKDVVDEMFAGISRAICSLVPDFEGEKIEQIILTGGAARWPLLVESIKKDLFALGIGVCVYPGEKELEAMRDGVLRITSKEEKVKEY